MCDVQLGYVRRTCTMYMYYAVQVWAWPQTTVATPYFSWVSWRTHCRILHCSIEMVCSTTVKTSCLVIYLFPENCDTTSCNATSRMPRLEYPGWRIFHRTFGLHCHAVNLAKLINVSTNKPGPRLMYLQTTNLTASCIFRSIHECSVYIIAPACRTCTSF